MLKERWIKREKIMAVHDKDLEELLSTIGLLNEIKNGKCNCNECGVIITIENIGAIYPKEGNIYFICEKLSCLDKANLYSENKNE